MASIRPYRASDEEAVIHIFRETAAPDLRAHPDPDVLHVGSFMWCRPYIALTPDWCFVLDNGNGNAVGYILCAPNTPSFVQRFKEELFPTIVQYGITMPETTDTNSDLATQFRKDVFQPDNMLHSDHPGLIRNYPAHLHIDILSSHQGQGWGQKLVKTLLEKLQTEHVPGIHLGMVAENHSAGRFYARLGFERFKEMKENNEVGRKGSAIYLVKSVT